MVKCLILSNLVVRYNTKFMKEISEALDQYTGICKEAIMDSAAKLSKSFEKVIVEVLLLYMVIPGRINITQLGKYGRHGEQCFCGLTDSQARDTNKLDCAFNASFASLNVAKVMMKERGMQYSMSNFKLLMTNTFLTKRIFDVSRYRPNQTLINHIFKELFDCAA